MNLFKKALCLILLASLLLSTLASCGDTVTIAEDGSTTVTLRFKAK